ncbi:MAC/Perforin domain-containing protein [Wolffia australiana]
MKMGENAAALDTVHHAIRALGRGFDVNYDARLLYCKGVGGSRVVEIDEEQGRDLLAFGDLLVPNVPKDVRFSQGTTKRVSTAICSFHEMAEYFNRKAHLTGSIPLGSFNAAFSYSGSIESDVAVTKSLALDGIFISLCEIELVKYPFLLKEEVKRAVPPSWDPSSLANFIKNYGTHVVTSLTIGGKDVIYVKQLQSSSLPALDIKNYIRDIGDHRFSDNDVDTTPSSPKENDKDLDSANMFTSQGVHPQPLNPSLPGNEDVTVIFRRQGGNELVKSHHEWARTVPWMPDVILMGFYPITCMLDGVPGKDSLVRAISLYLEYKPPIEELRYFLEFQVPKVWAPVRSTLPGLQQKDPVCPFLQFSMMGEKLYVSQEQVLVGRRPVTGLRLALEGAKENRLCIQVQHLASLPRILVPCWDAHIAIGAPKWVSPEEQDSRWFEPVKWKNFSHVSTAPVGYNESSFGDLAGVQIVTGAQLSVWDFGSKNVLYMKLLYQKIPDCSVRRSFWDQDPDNYLAKENKDSKVASSSKDGKGGLSKFIDFSEMSKGPQDSPGHWVVTGAKLAVNKGKITLRVKYSLLNY